MTTPTHSLVDFACGGASLHKRAIAGSAIAHQARRIGRVKHRKRGAADDELAHAALQDFCFAFALGIAFQFFTIRPMRHLSVSAGLVQALKADCASLTAWQIGMYGWMALVTFAFFGHELPKDDPVFWFMMQLAMLAGFMISWPVNAWLIRIGVKEAM